MESMQERLKRIRSEKGRNSSDLNATNDLGLKVAEKHSESSHSLTLRERMAQVKAASDKADAAKRAGSNNIEAELAQLKEDNAKLTAQVNELLKEELLADKEASVVAQSSPASNEIRLNKLQQQAIMWAVAGVSFALTGGAGTGKTTTVQAFLNIMRSKVRQSVFRNPTGGIKDQEEKPSIACVALANRAVNNMLSSAKRNKPEMFDSNAALNSDQAELTEGNFITMHKLLEFYPHYYVNQDGKETMKFIPNRDADNQLDLQTIIIEEASTCDINFSNILANAIENGVQIIFLGDINQLPPVFGDSILNEALKRLPVINLTEVYRQALDSPIIRQAHAILAGKKPISDTTDFRLISGNDKAAPMGATTFGTRIANILKQEYDAGKYKPSTNMVLSPWNKHGAGTDRLNMLIAQFLDKDKRDKEIAETGEAKHKVHEIVSGFNRVYFAVGDRVYDSANKEEGIITAIRVNGLFYGKLPQPATVTLMRCGIDPADSDLAADLHPKNADPFETSSGLYDYSNLDLDKETVDDIADRVQQASHTIEVNYPALAKNEGVEDYTQTLSTSAAINALSLGYVLTAHKAQGCEWDSVYVVIHQSHFSANREWLYTAVTRAKNSCTILAKTKTIEKTVARQRCKGDTLDEKIASYNEKNRTKLSNGDKTPEAKLLDKIKLVEIPND